MKTQTGSRQEAIGNRRMRAACALNAARFHHLRPRIRGLLLVLICTAALQGEIIDRVAVTVDSQMITESDIRNDIRIAAFLNGEPVDFSPAQLRKAADRLVDVALIRREMELTRFQMPDDAEVARMLEQVRAQRFAGGDDYPAALDKYGITERMLRYYLLWQLATLRYIDFRFSPGLLIPEDDLQLYYNATFLPAWRKKNAGPPPEFEEVRPEIEKAVGAARADQALEAWLKDTRDRAESRFRQEAFR